MKKLLLLLCASTALSLPAQVFTAGIPSGRMDYVAADQKFSMWCWAASIQMVMNYYGIDVTQDEIVRRSFNLGPNDPLPNSAGNIRVITANLNGWGVGRQGRYTVQCFLGRGAPVPDILLAELANGRPVIAGYASGPNSGHAVVVTAVTYSPTPSGALVHSIIARDPWPSPENIANRGRVVYSAAPFAQRMQNYWYVYVVN